MTNQLTNTRPARCATCRATVPPQTGTRITSYRTFTLCPTCAATEDAIDSARADFNLITDRCQLHIVDISILRQALRRNVPAADIASVVANLADAARPGLNIYNLLDLVRQQPQPHAEIINDDWMEEFVAVDYTYSDDADIDATPLGGW